MDDIEPASPTPAERRRVIRYGDEEATIMSPGPGKIGPAITLPPLQRTKSSVSTMSNRSVMSLNRRNSVDPAVALPIQYRSM